MKMVVSAFLGPVTFSVVRRLDLYDEAVLNVDKWFWCNSFNVSRLC
jgi:hypothetical protein